MALPPYLQDAVEEGRGLHAETTGKTPTEVGLEQLALLDNFVSNFVKYRLPRSIRAVEASGGSSFTISIPGVESGVQDRILDPIESITGLAVQITPEEGTGFDLLTITWPGASLPG